jgi:DNA-binding LacI/PurR family transcriptional regulator
VATKAGRIREALRAAIETGTLKPGDRLPSMRALAAEHEVTVVTAGKAVAELEQLALVQRQQGRGTFVTELEPAETSLVAALMPTCGHAFDRLFSALVTAFANRHLDLLPTHTSWGPEVEETADSAIRRALHRELRAVLVDGAADFPFPLLNTPVGAPVTFVHRYETSLPFHRANRVLTNYRLAGAMAAAHLLDSGAQRLLLLTISEHYATRPMPYGGVSIAADFEAGIGDTLDRHGIAPAGLHRLWGRGADLDAQLVAALAAGVDGVICFGDHRAIKVYDAAAAASRVIGDDLLVIGCYDTPWCGALSPALSSINIQEARIAGRVAQAVAEGWEAETCLVPPRLALRPSAPPLAAALTPGRSA